MSKRSLKSKLLWCCSVLMVILLVSTIFVSVFSIKNQPRIYEDTIQNVDSKEHAYKLLTSDEINENTFKKIKLKNVDKVAIITKLTDYFITQEKRLKFDQEQVKKNLIEFVNTLLKQNKFKTEDPSMVIKYKITNDYNLKLEIRWANKNIYNDEIVDIEFYYSLMDITLK